MKSPLKPSTFTLAAATAVLGCAILVAVSGYYSIKSRVAHSAELAANTWLAAALQETRGDILAIPALLPERLLRLNQGLGADATAVVTPTGTRLLGVDEGRAGSLAGELERAAGDVAGNALIQMPTTSFTIDVSQLAPIPRFVTWVLLPRLGGDGSRIALRFAQQETASRLFLRYYSSSLYLAGIAIVTFCSFMAGFTYRARQIAEEEARNRYLAFHDELTTLPNRKSFEVESTASFQRLRAEGRGFALMMLDLDGFKGVNDTLGHPIGDALLKAVGSRLKTSLRAHDFLCRLSGDEFAVIVNAFEGPNELGPLAKRIRDAVNATFIIDGHKIVIGCSIGIAIAPGDAATPEELVRHADFALYRAKAQGKSTWRFFDPDMTRDQENRRLIEAGLRLAVERGHFGLVYQPQRDLATKAVVGYEALLRWELPDGRVVPASAFMAVAEETGLIATIGEWVIARGVEDLARLPAPLRLAINLSPPQLKREGLDALLAATLARHAVEPERLEIEVNESLLGRNEEQAFKILERISALGIVVVMDRFGNGTSSLGMLSRYPFDKVKVAKSFIANVDSDDKARAVLGAMCLLGRSLGLAVSGDGVETEAHAAILKDAGCQIGQGFHFGRPEPIEAIVAALAPSPALPSLAVGLPDAA